MSKMFGGIQGIMASDIQTRHSMLSGTIREKRREREADTEGEEEHTSLVTSERQQQTFGHENYSYSVDSVSVTRVIQKTLSR